VSAARLAARALDLLGPVEGPVVVACPARLAAAIAPHRAVAADGAVGSGAVVAFLGAAVAPAERHAVLTAVARRLAPGAPLVVLDHNQPRTWWRRLAGAAVLAARALPPARARYPAARELAALGFVVERLRLACGERVQLVRALRR